MMIYMCVDMLLICMHAATKRMLIFFKSMLVLLNCTTNRAGKNLIVRAFIHFRLENASILVVS